MDSILRKLPSRQVFQGVSAWMPPGQEERLGYLVDCIRKFGDLYLSTETWLAAHNLSLGRLGVLTLLLSISEDWLTPSELADHAGVTRGTMTGLLQGLEAEGLIERLRHPDDKRKVAVRLTDSGYEKIAHILPQHFRRMGQLVGDISDEELRHLTTIMAKVRL
ncbi:MAG TPA: MarR family transcriptional regulator [Symbiobacteriaceae bacterium]|nr:MarR family transcriptional regulator [Symbiobacteriaceae bacterium]